jgi:hypothetical protein
MRLRRDAQAVIHRVMHRPRGKQGLDFRILVHCTMPFPHWQPHVSCAQAPCIAASHVGALPCRVFHSRRSRSRSQRAVPRRDARKSTRRAHVVLGPRMSKILRKRGAFLASAGREGGRIVQMTEPGNLPDDQLVERARLWRLMALRGERHAHLPAHEHEAELRRRQRAAKPGPLQAHAEAQPQRRLWRFW